MNLLPPHEEDENEGRGCFVLQKRDLVVVVNVVIEMEERVVI